MITFVSWKWKQPGCRSEYSAEHVNVWASMLDRCYDGPKRVICITDNPKGITGCETFPIWSDFATLVNPNGMKKPYGAQLPSCFRRLKIFHEPQTRAMGIEKFSKVVSMDLDMIMLREINPLFELNTNEFVGWKRIGPGHPNGYNGSIFMFRTGMLDRIWETFDPETSPMIACRMKYYGSDQGWMSYCLRGTMPGWGKIDGVYSFSSDVSAKPFPANARLIFFNGKAKPWDALVQRNHSWIARFWRSGPSLPGDDFESRAMPRSTKRFAYR